MAEFLCVSASLREEISSDLTCVNTLGATVARKNAYTLIEVLVVAVVVVLMLGMALPVFRAITGSRSEAGASNIIASMLGRARTDAIGLQKPIGVAFVYDPTAQLSYMAEVEFPDSPSWFTGQLVPPLGYVSAVYGGWTYYYINNGTYTDPSTSSTTVKLLVQPARLFDEPAARHCRRGRAPTGNPARHRTAASSHRHWCPNHLQLQLQHQFPLSANQQRISQLRRDPLRW